MPHASPYASLATLATSERQRKARQPLHPFAGCIGGSFKPRSFDPGTPSLRAIDAAADRVARDAADAKALRDNYLRFTSTHR
jgi:hypothetical protein